MFTGTPTCTMYWYKSPSGKMFRGKKSALRFMESSKHCTPEDVRKFKSTQGTDKKFTKVKIIFVFMLLYLQPGREGTLGCLLH